MARQIRGWIPACALAAALSVGGGIARANFLLVPCTLGTGFDYGSSPHVICGGADAHGAGGGVVFNGSPNPFLSFLSGAGGSMGSAGGGVGGVSASAAGSGTFGEIHLFASADNGEFTDNLRPDHLGSASAFAEIAFVDGGLVNGPAGSPVDIRLTIGMEGGFSGVGEGDFEFDLFDGVSFLGMRRAFLYSGAPSVSYTWDLTVQGGDTLFFGMDMWAQASSTNDGVVVARSTADVSHTGRVELDVLTPGSDFVSNSGTNYSSAASVPEPGSALLLAGGLVAMVAFYIRTRRSSSRAAGNR